MPGLSGMSPRRNPDIAVVVLVEHGGLGAEASAPLAAKIVEAFVDKQRRLDNNLQEGQGAGEGGDRCGVVGEAGGQRTYEACHGGQKMRLGIQAGILRCRRNEWNSLGICVRDPG